MPFPDNFVVMAPLPRSSQGTRIFPRIGHAWSTKDRLWKAIRPIIMARLLLFSLGWLDTRENGMRGKQACMQLSHQAPSLLVLHSRPPHTRNTSPDLLLNMHHHFGGCHIEVLDVEPIES